MDETEKDWVKNPTIKQLSYVIILWVVSIEFIIISITDKFTKSFIQNDQYIMYLLILGSTLTVIYMIRNYFKNKKINQH